MDHLALVRQEEQDGVGDVGGLGEPPQRDASEHRRRFSRIRPRLAAHVRHGDGGAHGVDADAERAQLQRHAARQLIQGAFGRAVGRPVGHGPAPRRHGRDIHHRSSTCRRVRGPEFRHGLRQKHGTAHVRRVVRVPVLRRHLQKRRRPRHARAIHDQIDAPEGVPRRLDALAARLRVRHVKGEAAERVLEAVVQLRERLHRARHAKDAAALLDELDADLSSYPPTRTRDERDFAVEAPGVDLAGRAGLLEHGCL